jgi:hypothetical protein
MTALRENVMNSWHPILSALAFALLLNSASGQGGGLTITVQGYEVSQATAAELLEPQQLQASAMVRKLSTMMTEKKAAKVVMFGNASGPIGARMRGTDEGGSFETEAVVSPDGLWADIIIALKTPTATLNTGSAVSMGGFLLLGIIEGRTEGQVILLFAHASRS